MALCRTFSNFNGHVRRVRLISCALSQTFPQLRDMSCKLPTLGRPYDLHFCLFVSDLVWHILKLYEDVADASHNISGSSVVKETCSVLHVGLNVLYSSAAERYKLLHCLLAQGKVYYMSICTVVNISRF